MIVTISYEVDMTYLNVQLSGVDRTIRILASEIEENQGTAKLLAKNEKGEIVAKFPMSNVLGWWTEA